MDFNIASRLKSFIEYTGLNNSQFADACSVPKPSLSQILSGRNKKVSNQLLELLHTAFPQLNISWLLFGEGDMLTRRTDGEFASSGDPDSPAIAADSEPPSIYGYPDESEISFLPTNYSEVQKESSHNGLTNPQNADNSSDNKPLNTNLQIHKLQLQIENLQDQIEKIHQNPRKVASITVYYDDSTFETFLPG